MNKNGSARNLVTLTVLLAVILLAAAWFLLVSPVMTGAAQANSQAQQQEANNANTQIEVNKLRAQYENMPEYEAQLAELQIQIPTSQEYANLQRHFAAIANAHDVVITSLRFGTATRIQVEPTGDEGEVPAGETTEPTEDPEGQDPAPADNGRSAFYTIPVEVAMDGAYADVLAALNELQTGVTRLVLVTNVTLMPSDSVEAEEGDTLATFGGSTFVLTSSQLEEEAPPDDAADDGTSPSPTPAP